MKKPNVSVKEIYPKLRAPVLEPYFGLIALSFKNSQKEDQIWEILDYLDNTTKYYLLTKHQLLFNQNDQFRERLKNLEMSLDQRFCSISTLHQIIENINKRNYVVTKEAIYQLVGNTILFIYHFNNFILRYLKHFFFLDLL